MAVSKDAIICPYCKAVSMKSSAIGTAGLINYNGTELGMTCWKCGQDFTCEIIVDLKFKTRRE